MKIPDSEKKLNGKVDGGQAFDSAILN